MLNFIMMTLAIMLGTLLATGVLLLLVMNKKVMKAYTKNAMKISEELANEYFDNLEKEEEI